MIGYRRKRENPIIQGETKSNPFLKSLCLSTFLFFNLFASWLPFPYLERE